MEIINYLGDNPRFIYLGSRIKSGKTYYAITWMCDIAVNEEKRIAFFCPEDRKESVITKMEEYISSIGLNWADYKDFFYINDKAGISSFEVCQEVRSQWCFDLVVIDGLQNFGDSKYSHSMELASNMFRSLQEDLGISVIILTQLQKTADDRVNHIPIIEDIRFSNLLIKNNDEVRLLVRPNLYDLDISSGGGPRITSIQTRKEECFIDIFTQKQIDQFNTEYSIKYKAIYN